ncbi:Phosphomannomutase [Nowakowskiella sp. JEL0078]|nr:Phosphomannomutase [Nowakowskiella sp. JEL0078]
MSADWTNKKLPTTICLFDVDGTITPARRTISPEMKQLIAELRKICIVGFVGGSDLPKQIEQIGENAIDLFDFAFAENGLTAYRLSKPLPSLSFIEWLGEEKYQALVNFVLKYIADLDIPQKRHEERDEFEKYDKFYGIRTKFVNALKEAFPDYGLTYSIGGQISFDVFPEGWDKTFCLRNLESEGIETIHFFGDKTFKGGNDYEIYEHPKVTGHSVTSPLDTARLLKEIFGI